MDSRLTHTWRARDRCQGSAYRLQNEREKVEGNEGNRIEAWAEARQVSPIYHNNASEADIDGNAQEGRGDCDPDEIAGGMVSSAWLDFLFFVSLLEALLLEPAAAKRKVM